MIKEFFTLNLADYENIGLIFPIGAVIFLFAVAAAIAVFFTHFYKSQSLALVKQLVRHEAFDEERAKTLKALRLSPSFLLKRILESGEIKSIVRRHGEVKPTYEEYVEASRKKGYKPEKVDYDSAKFYLTEDGKGRAEKIISDSRPAIWKPILFTVIAAALVVLLMVFLPDMLSALDKALK